MAAAGFKAGNITYLGLSHYHGDHTANANDFAGATWLVQQTERDAMFAEKAPNITQLAQYAALKNSKTKILNGEDFDVFGDGTVVIKAAYGHTPGHQVLFVKLAKTGPVLLAGYLYHYQEERGTSKVPTFEFNKEQSLASRVVIEAFLKQTGAQLWIEHDLANFIKLQKESGVLRIDHELQQVAVGIAHVDAGGAFSASALACDWAFDELGPCRGRAWL